MSHGPIVMSVAGDEFIQPARIASIIWEGSTGIGDTVTLVHGTVAEEILWVCRTNAVNTYLGVAFGLEGHSAPNGFKLSAISNGRVLVYLREA